MPRVDIGASLEQQGDHLLFASPDCIVQRGSAQRIDCVHRDAVLEQDADPFCVAGTDGFAQIVGVCRKDSQRGQ